MKEEGKVPLEVGCFWRKCLFQEESVLAVNTGGACVSVNQQAEFDTGF